MQNNKPYRTKAQKLEAKQTATKDKDGAFRSLVPRSYHTTQDGNKIDRRSKE